MRVAFLSAFLVVAACEQESPTTSARGSAEQLPATSSLTVGAVEGWETRQEGYAKLGSTAPDFFTTPQGGGLAITQDALRNHWTILSFPAISASADEARFVGALKSAVDQDPDLDFMAIDDAVVAAAFAIEKTPAYLLIGPDMTIEAYRGALSATPEDGIKPVIRGVAEIKRQIAAPE
jgi:hypothetical protein